MLALTVIFATVVLPFLLIIQYARHLTLLLSARYYMTPERDAVLGVRAIRTGWIAQDHASARPGTGRGRALRDLVIPTLTQAADQESVALRLKAADECLARNYEAEIPGLVDVGPAWPHGREMRRAARPAALDVKTS